MDVCLLHGFAQPPSSWAEVQAVLGGSRAVARPTPGHDPSLPIRGGWDQAIADLAATLPADAVVVGYSFGARLALGLLAIDAVRAAVLVGVNPGLADPTARAARRADDQVWADRLRTVGVAGFLDAWERQALFATQARAPVTVRDRRRQARAALAAPPLACALEQLGLGAMPDLGPALVSRAARAHLVVGADDARCLAIAQALRREAPALAVDVIAGSGHVPTLEAPAALAAVLDAALARLGER